MKTRILPAILMVFWAFVTVAQNNVGIGTTNPVSKLDVRGNGIGYDVFNASNDKILPLDSIFVIDSVGHVGIGVINIGAYNLLSNGLLPSAFSPKIEVYQGNPNLSSSRMLCDINDVGTPPFNGVLNLYLNGNRRIELKAFGGSYLNGGNVGIGIGMGPTAPNEILHLGGAIVVGGSTATTPLAGTIQWNGANFQGYFGGGAWLNLDVQAQPQYWMQQVSPLGQSELLPNTLPSSIALGCPANVPNPGGMFWLNDMAANFAGTPRLYPHLLILESTASGQADASMHYRIASWVSTPNPPYWTYTTMREFSQGIYRSDLSFKLYNGQVLGPTSQGDGSTMLRANPSGIIDLPNQSRVRATVPYIDWASWQLIQPNLWTPVNFTNPPASAPLIAGIPFWDEQVEFTIATSPNQATPPVNSFFTAKQDGFYQVNARCEFETDEYNIQGMIYPVVMRPEAFVAIAVYIDVAGGPANWISYAIGNHLQITSNVPLTIPNPEYQDATKPLMNNNAPNVSDVVYLQQGDRLSIWVFQWAYTPMMLRVGNEILYVSIHKGS